MPSADGVARHLIRRGVRAIATLLLLAVTAWLCLEAAPGGPVRAAARASGLLPSDETRLTPDAKHDLLALAAAQHDLRGSRLDRVTRFATRLVRGDLGRSWRPDARSVSGLLVRALPATLGLLCAGALVAYLVGVALALLAAARPGGARDRGVNAATAIALALPPAWAAILALRTFVAGKPFTIFASEGFVLPISCLAYVAAAIVARHGRAALVDARGRTFVTAARARGASERRVLGVHALAVAAAPLASLFAPVMTYLLGASLVIERAFGIHGLGATILDAAAVGDAPVVLGGTIVAGAILVAASLTADVIALLADPRLEEQA